MKYSNQEHSNNGGEIPSEMRIERAEIDRIHREYDEALYEIIRSKFDEWDIPMPDLSPEELVAQAPQLLESASRETIQAQKEPFYIEGSAAAYEEFLKHPEVEKTKLPSAFILPPSFDELEKRLRNRSDSITEKEIQERLSAAVEHLQKVKRFKYDGYYVNDSLERIGTAIAEDALND